VVVVAVVVLAAVAAEDSVILVAETTEAMLEAMVADQVVMEIMLDLETLAVVAEEVMVVSCIFIIINTHQQKVFTSIIIFITLFKY